VACVVKENVFWFQIAMDYVLLVEMVGGQDHFCYVEPYYELIKIGPFFKHRSQIAPSHELHDEAHELIIGKDIQRIDYKLSRQASKHLLLSQYLSL